MKDLIFGSLFGVTMALLSVAELAGLYASFHVGFFAFLLNIAIPPLAIFNGICFLL